MWQKNNCNICNKHFVRLIFFAIYERNFERIVETNNLFLLARWGLLFLSLISLLAVPGSFPYAWHTARKTTGPPVYLWTRVRYKSTVAEFIDPWLGDEVNPGMGLTYRPANPCSLAGRYDNPMPELTLSPQSESMSSAILEPKMGTVEVNILYSYQYCEERM
jgi:hypothetical protein